MTPTAKFRWFVPSSDMTWLAVLNKHPSAVTNAAGQYRVLQQWWEDDNYEINGVPKHSGEWRDIPVEEQA